jgi:hypothetical protein
MPAEIVDLPRGSRVIPHDVSMAMARGAGAPVSVNRQVNIINAPPGYYPEVEEEDDGQGNEKVNVTFSKMASAEASRPGSPFNRTLNRMGARPARKKR